MSLRTKRRLLVVGICLAGAGCLSDDERQTINDWLTCEECNAGERQAAVGVGWKAVPRLAGALQEGPSDQRLMNMNRQITASWRRLPSPRRSLQQTRDYFLDNYEAVYQARAALALGDLGRGTSIGAKRARNELRDAMRRDSTDRAAGGLGVFRDDVVLVIGGSLAGTMTVSKGDAQEALPGTAVDLPPTVLVLDANGDPVRGAPVSFEVVSGGGSLGSLDQTTDATGEASAGDWILGPAVGTNRLTATTPELAPLVFTATAIAPTIASLDPASGLVGTRVRILGQHLTGQTSVTAVTLNGTNVDLFVVSTHGDSVVVLMPLAGQAGAHTVVVQAAGTASAGATWQQVGVQEAGDPDNDSQATAPTVVLPLDVVGTFSAGDENDFYSLTLSAPATLVIDLDWDAPGLDLDVLVLDDPSAAIQCADGATGAQPEQAVCSLPPGDYSILVNDFSASMGDMSATSYRLRVTQ